MAARRRLSAAEFRAAVDVSNAAARKGAAYLGQRIADRLHVGASVLSVLRAVRRGMILRVRRARVARGWRRTAYKAALSRHADNRATYRSVYAGRVAAFSAYRAAAMREIGSDLARYRVPAPQPPRIGA